MSANSKRKINLCTAPGLCFCKTLSINYREIHSHKRFFKCAYAASFQILRRPCIRVELTMARNAYHPYIRDMCQNAGHLRRYSYLIKRTYFSTRNTEFLLIADAEREF